MTNVFREVLPFLAIDEATLADRLYTRSQQHTAKALLCGQTYSRRLKQLIN